MFQRIKVIECDLFICFAGSQEASAIPFAALTAWRALKSTARIIKGYDQGIRYQFPLSEVATSNVCVFLCYIVIDILVQILIVYSPIVLTYLFQFPSEKFVSVELQVLGKTVPIV